MVVEFEAKGRVAIITLNRPEARNAVNAAVASGLEKALDDYEANPSLWAAILTAKGKAFCAGADLKEIAAGNAAGLSTCLLYTSPSPRDRTRSRMPSSA